MYIISTLGGEFYARDWRAILVPGYDCFKKDRTAVVFEGDDRELHLFEDVEINYIKEVDG